MSARDVEPDGEIRGLTPDEVAERVAAGRVNIVPPAPVRTNGEIVRANVFTWVNLIVGTLFVLLVIAGRVADGLFVGVVVSNSLIGIVQELVDRAWSNTSDSRASAARAGVVGNDGAYGVS